MDQGSKPKGEIFFQHQMKFKEEFVPIGSLEKERAKVHQDILIQLDKIKPVLNCIRQNPIESQFERLEEIFEIYKELKISVSQAKEFYTTLKTEVNNLSSE